MANQVDAKLIIQILANAAGLIKGLKQSQSQLNGFVSSIRKVAGAVGIAFGTQQIISFASEVTKLAGEAEGVRNAFDRLPSSIRLMEDLKEATGGTVSELNLMKRAVQASNFDISLQSLPKLLEFAAVRAQQTGQSVDYLVDSIVTGIGRKSPLILDNLGISASRLREEMNGVSLASAEVGEVSEAVGRIASAELEKMGGLADTAKTKTERLAASWENVKVSIGEAANEAGLLGSAIDSITGALDFAAEDSLSFWEKLGFALQGFNGAAAASAEIVKRNTQALSDEQKRNEQVIREVDKAYIEFNKNIEAYGEAIQTHILRTELLAEFQKRLNEENEKGAAEIVNIANLTTKLNTLNQERLTLTGAQLAATNNEIKAVKAQIKALEELGTVISIARPPDPVEIPITVNTNILFDEVERLRELGITVPITFDPDFSQLLDAINTVGGGIQIGDDIREALFNEKEHVEATGDAIRASLESTKSAAIESLLGITNAISQGVNSLVSGQQDAAQALAGVTLDIIDSFIKQALAAAIANAVSTPGVPIPIGLALAGVAIGAVKALFSKNVGRSGSGGGGGGGAGGLTPARGVRSEAQAQSVRIELGQTEFVMRGDVLVAQIRQQEFKSNRLGG